MHSIIMIICYFLPWEKCKCRILFSTVATLEQRYCILRWSMIIFSKYSYKSMDLWAWCSHTERQQTHRLAHTDNLVALSETHGACGLSGSIQPLGLWHFCFPGLPLALPDSDGVSNKQSLSLATSAQLKTTGIVQLAFVYRNLQVFNGPCSLSHSFAFLVVPVLRLILLCLVSYLPIATQPTLLSPPTHTHV